MSLEYKEMPFEIKDMSEEGIIKGYGSTFGGEPDSYGDVIAKGAFKDSIEKGGRNGNGFPMLWNHNSSEPIGKWDVLVEDKNGLYVEGHFNLKVQRAQEIHALAKDKVIQGLSIGYNTLEKENMEDGNTLLKKLSLWEISPVTFPANIRADIHDVKSIKDALTVRELEKALRDAGLSRKDALYLATMCKQSLGEPVNDELVVGLLLAELKDINTKNQIKHYLGG